LSIVAGNPARVVKTRDPAVYERLKSKNVYYWKERDAGRLQTDRDVVLS
jgi:hypothetical protein